MQFDTRVLPNDKTEENGLIIARQKCVRVSVHACMRVCVHACVRVLVRAEVTSDTGLFIFFSGTVRNRQYDCSKVLMTLTVDTILPIYTSPPNCTT